MFPRCFSTARSASVAVRGLWQGRRVELAGAPRTVSDVRDRFIERLNSAVLRPGMWGGELTLQMVLDDLAWLDGQEHVRPGVAETLDADGAWSSIGVSGVFVQMFGRRAVQHQDAAGVFPLAPPGPALDGQRRQNRP
jgi:hypothetical protein